MGSIGPLQREGESRESGALGSVVEGEGVRMSGAYTRRIASFESASFCVPWGGTQLASIVTSRSLADE